MSDCGLRTVTLRRVVRSHLGAAAMPAAVCLILVAGVCRAAEADNASPPRFGPDPAAYRQVVDRGIAYLVDRGQAADGSFSGETGIGITALAVTALLQNGKTVNDPAVRSGLAFLEKHVQPDGGIYFPGTYYKNYETSIAIMCLHQADAERYRQIIENAERFVKGIQWDESEDQTPADYAYGGAGYGRHRRPDLSNTAFLLEALRSIGRGPDDPAVQKALIFVSRCQNLETEHNTTPFAAKNPDGGFYYTPAAGGQSMAGETPTGGLRSYASMTYAGLKSMIYAGLKADDPRVKAAKEWIAKNYDLESNPGMGQQGLYYYYHTFAKTMDVLGEPIFTDAAGKAHDWRAELFDALRQRQRPDGSWVNEADRWMEGDANLVTAYSLMALSYCRP
ncbi:prenyltransferase/squalene oxidase repeat-containing protein [Thermopirellula anaerolimosa]